MKTTAFLLAGLAALAAGATPTISDISFSVTDAGLLQVDYTLGGETCIVMPEIETNAAPGAAAAVWVPIGTAAVTELIGDVQCKVEAGARRFWWDVRGVIDGTFALKDMRVKLSAWSEKAPPDYMSISLTDGHVMYWTSTNQLPGGIGDDLWRTDRLLLRKIPAKGVTWTMGSPSNTATTVAELGRSSLEHPHRVKFTRDYYIGVFEVTQWQYWRMMGSRPSAFSNETCWATRPVERVHYDTTLGATGSWPGTPPHSDASYAASADTFVKRLRDISKLDIHLTLPTEAQWEFACRAGTGTALYTGENLVGSEVSANLNGIARYKSNGGLVGGTTAPVSATADTSVGTARVGSYAPNGFGLYDMLGNVWEMCLDWYGRPASNLVEGVEFDPVGTDKETSKDRSAGTSRAARGGSWSSPSGNCRASALASAQMWLNVASGAVWEQPYCGDANKGFRMCYTIFE